MELKDFVVTPLLLILVMTGAYFIRPWVTNEETRRYFLPALAVRVISAILVGFLYQFYYSTGDTFMYHTFGSSIIYDALLEDPFEGISLLFTDGNRSDHSYYYTSQIRYFGDASSYMIVRIATIMDLITFSTYSATAVLFAVLNFSGMWCLYLFFRRATGSSSKWLPIGILFAPSVVFWGSGILKDSITLACVGWSLYGIHELFFARRRVVLSLILILFSFYLIFIIKLYVLLCLLPAILFYLYFAFLRAIRSPVLRYLTAPFLLLVTIVFAYLAVDNISTSDSKYELDNIAVTARTTAYDIAYWTGRNAGSTYTLGELDGTLSGMVSLAPQAINVSLFRPYLWEIRNPLMVLSAFESITLLLVTIYILTQIRPWYLKTILNDPVIIMSFFFALIFAFGVGISTYNFGSLSRYRIPLIPFYVVGIVMVIECIRGQKRIVN